jgi:hypothetical protein
MNNKKCKKKKLDKIIAMFIVAQGKNGSHPRRKEKRLYFCKECDAYHTTRDE